MENRPGRLPEGVGKKIVDALKQDNIEIKEVNEEQFESTDSFETSADFENEFAQQRDSQNFENKEVMQEEIGIDELKDSISQEAPTVNQQPFSPAFNVPKQMPKTEATLKEVEMPANVDILKRLITQLPPGVTRQTGAQIIRQTMEAMGISMKSVLQEAQFIQEELGNSAKDCLNTVEEYKNNIRLLERKVQNYKKQANQLSELINLFIMSEKKGR